MLLDEPTQGMGHEDVARVTELIKRVAAGRTVLMVEHNMSVVAGISDQITVLARGAVLAEGPYSTSRMTPASRKPTWALRRLSWKASGTDGFGTRDQESARVVRRIAHPARCAI